MEPSCLSRVSATPRVKVNEPRAHSAHWASPGSALARVIEWKMKNLEFLQQLMQITSFCETLNQVQRSWAASHDRVRVNYQEMTPLTMITAIIWGVMAQIWDLLSANASANYHFYGFLVCCCHSGHNHLSLKTAFLKQGKHTKWREQESKYCLMPRGTKCNWPLVAGPKNWIVFFTKLLIFMRLTLL